MKVYACPRELPAPEHDFSAPVDDLHAKDMEHAEKLKAWLITAGYTGEHTGKILWEPVGDGYACYMYGDKAAKSALFHLPYGDAWHSPNIQYLPKREVLRRIARFEAVKALFSKKEAS